MAVLQWDQSGARYYEGGIDRVVFYPKYGPGIAWTGVISIEENVVGGDVKPYYFDGVKLLDVVEEADLQLILTAFAAPKLFYACDGIAQVQRGLFVTQQAREFFGLSYRTKVFNETGEIGYKINLVYNAMASFMDKGNVTLGGNVSPTPLKWTIDTVPMENTTRKPTSNMTIRSTSFTTSQISELEDILYGTVSTDPKLPTRAVLESTLGGL